MKNWRERVKLTLTARPTFLVATFLLLFVIFSAALVINYSAKKKSMAANVNCYWVGSTSPASWNSAASWSSSSGGTPSTCDGGIIPASTDTAYFTSANTNSATIDTNVNIKGINIGTGYTGTIAPSGAETVTLGANGYVQADGTFTTSVTMTLNSSFNQSGGIFTATSGTLAITGSFTKSAGTFNEGTGTVSFNSSSSANTINVATTETFYNVILNSPSTNQGITLATGDTVVVDGTLSLTNGGVWGPGIIDARGNIDQAATFDGGSARLNFANDTLVQTYTIAGGSIGPYLYLDDPDDASDSVVFSGAATLYGLNITAGFSGTMPIADNSNNITLGAGGFTLAANTTFDKQLVSTSTFTQSDGIFTAIPGTLTITGSFTKSTGTFNEGTGTVLFNSPSSANTINVATTETFYNVIFNTPSTNQGITLATGDTVVVDGTLSLTNGGVWGPGIIDARGDVTVASTFDGGSAMLKLSGSNTQSFNLTGATGTFNSDITVSKSGGQVNLASALIMDAASQDLVIQSGTFDLNGNALTVNGTSGTLVVQNTGILQLQGGALTVNGTSGTLVVQNGGILQLQGGEAVTTNVNNPQLQTGSTVEYYGTAGPYTLKSFAYANLTIDGVGTTFNLPATLAIAGNLNIINGILDVTASNYALSVAGNWNNAGTFTPRSGTVNLNGVNQAVNGSASFYNFNKTETVSDSTDSTLTFQNGQTQTVAGLLTINGLDDNDRINLVSSSPGSYWNLIGNGTFAINYADVIDSDASGGTTVPATFTIDSGHNLNWAFDPTPAPSTKTWSAAADGNWETAGNWTPSGAPATGDAVTFDSTSIKNCTVTTYTLGNGIADALASLSVNVGYSGIINFQSKPSQNADPYKINITGDFTINAGTVTSEGDTTFVHGGLTDGRGNEFAEANLTVASGASFNANGKGFASNSGPGYTSQGTGSGYGGDGGSASGHTYGEISLTQTPSVLEVVCGVLVGGVTWLVAVQ